MQSEEVGSLFASTAPDPAQYLNSVDTQAGAGMLVRYVLALIDGALTSWRLEASMRKLHENNDALILMAEVLLSSPNCNLLFAVRGYVRR